MSMFPGAGAQIFRNEAGEVLGWDYPSEPDPGDAQDALDEDEEEPTIECECGEVIPNDENDICEHNAVCRFDGIPY